VKDLNLRRDVISLRLSDGKLSFFQPLEGRVTGAVFTGRGHVIATPHDLGERRSLAQFLGVPILDVAFSRAYFRFDDDTASEIKQQLDATHAEAANDPAFAEGWGHIVAVLNPSHSLRILRDWLSMEPLPYFYAGLVNDSLGTFDLVVDPRLAEQVLIGQPWTTNAGQSYDVWASFRAIDAPSTLLQFFAPLDYRIETTIGDNLALEGKTVLHLKAGRSGERVVPLELSRKLAVGGITGEGGQPLVYFQNEDLSRREIVQRGNDTVLAVLPTPVRAGEEFHLEVSYHGSVISNAGNGVEFVGERGAWYAHVGGFDAFVPFDLSFRWPKRFTLVATGKRVESHEDTDPKTGRWRSDTPFVVAGFNLGEYKVETAGTDRPKIRLYANPELEDAILARLRQNVRSLLPPPPILGPNGVAPYLIMPPPPPPSPASVLRHMGSEIMESIHFYEKINGPYPFESLDVSQIPGSFGQGWPGLVYLSTLAFLPPDAQRRVGLDETSQEEERDLIPFHEVAHQWWGNIVCFATYRDVWLEEGMANYLALLYADSKKPGEHYLRKWLNRYRTALITKAPGLSETAEDAGPLSLGFRLDSSKNPDAYTTVIYGKGTWVIHMLREMMVDSGAKEPDARFYKLLRSILVDHRFQVLSTADFQRSVERDMTPSMDLEGTHSMDWFFEEWVRGTGIPHYKVEFQAKPHRQGFIVTGKLEQTEVDNSFTAPVPLYATHSGAKPDRLGVVVTTGPETRFRFVSPFRPQRLLIDPQLTLLCRTD
jgi:hypothetical protein